MFEREIKFIYDFNLNKVNRLGPYFTFEQLSAIDIHPAILHYISAEIDFLVFEDRQKLLKNSVFDYSGEKISYNFMQITEELKKTKRFSLEYIAKLILHASSFTINFLIRPKWTLSKFVFDESNHKSTNEIKQILNYIFYYKYLIKIISSYINTKKILSMNVEEFEALLNKADRLGVESYLPNIMSTSLKSMAEFFNIGEVKKFRVPLMAVELFLEEKELFKHLDILSETFGDDENAKFNIYDLQRVLSSIMIEKSETPPKIKETTKFEIVQTEIILPEDKDIVKEKTETIPEEMNETPPVREEIEDLQYNAAQKNEIIENESEAEFIKLKYASSSEINDENEEELSLEEDSVQNKHDELTDNVLNEPELSTTGFLNEEKVFLDEVENIPEEKDEIIPMEENENILIHHQNKEKLDTSVPVQEPIIELVAEQENNESNNLSENVEIESEDSSLKGDDKKRDKKIEEISSADEEIRIKLNTKFRIRVNEDNRIEPVIEAPDISHDDYKLFGDEPEDLLEKFIGGKPQIEDEIEPSNREGNDEFFNIIPEESGIQDLKKPDEEAIISTPEKFEEFENTFTTEKKDTFIVENKPDEVESEGTNSDLEDEFFELTVPVIPDVIEKDTSEDKKVLIFGDDGLEDNTIVEKLSEKEPEESDEEDTVDNSNFKEVLDKEIKVFDDEEIESSIQRPEKQIKKIDMAEILEHKNINKIIEFIFDYDIEDFANTIEEISNCKSINEANILFKDILAERHINRHSKEIEAFRSIIREFFN